MVSIPKAMCRSKLSLKANQASRAVHTPSALSSSEAPETVKPNSSTGPTTPPASTAPASHGHSPGWRRAEGARHTSRSRSRASWQPAGNWMSGQRHSASIDLAQRTDMSATSLAFKARSRVAASDSATHS